MLTLLFVLAVGLYEIHPCRPSTATGWTIFVGLVCPLFLAGEVLGEWAFEKRRHGTPRIARLLLWAATYYGLYRLCSNGVWTHHFRC